ncbi:MAG: GIY-YIG nuclease family protein [Desulfobacterales bacterium]|nr:GIY-YIG nuclease family protein [Desulfobacterales bacterium]MCP4160452.1 GIY-YIG nuclease family protein [Deltaproteobacteria bacterium]
MKSPCVYIMANKKNGTLYIGVTNDLIQSVQEYKHKHAENHHIRNLVYFEIHQNIVSALEREKQINKLDQELTIELIEKTNTDWVDLWNQIR